MNILDKFTILATALGFLLYLCLPRKIKEYYITKTLLKLSCFLQIILQIIVITLYYLGGKNV